MFPGRGSYGAPVESWLSTRVDAPRLHASIQFHDFRRAGNRDLGFAAISSASVAFRQRSGVADLTSGAEIIILRRHERP
jgi:hypothetical protein